MLGPDDSEVLLEVRCQGADAVISSAHASATTHLKRQNITSTCSASKYLFSNYLSLLLILAFCWRNCSNGPINMKKLMFFLLVAICRISIFTDKNIEPSRCLGQIAPLFHNSN